VPLLPPELTRPFPSDTERLSARRLVAQRDRTLQTIEELSNRPDSQWSSSELAAFPHTTNGVADPPKQRVARWANLFAEELAEVHRLVVGNRQLSDLELQETLYLAGRLLATVSDWSLDEIDNFTIN
jgi:hypothetical protein